MTGRAPQGVPQGVTDRARSGQSNDDVVARARPQSTAEPPHARGEDPFRALYEAHVAFVWRSLARVGAARDDIEDLAHETFLIAWRRLAEYDSSRPVRPWLFGIALRVLMNHRRGWFRRREQPWVDNVSPPGADLSAAHEARELVLRALRALDLDQRAVLCLHDIEGTTMPEIAAALSIPLNTGYSRLRLARARFAREVRRLRGAPPDGSGDGR